MASVFDGGGGALKSTTLPAALIELLERNQAGEQSVSTIPNKVTLLTYTTETGIVSFGGSLDLNVTMGDDPGEVQFVAQNYLGTVVPNFDPGTDGTLTAISYPAALYELLQKVAAAQVGSATPILTTFTQNNMGATPVATYAGSCRFSRTLDEDGKPNFTITDTL